MASHVKISPLLWLHMRKYHRCYGFTCKNITVAMASQIKETRCKGMHCVLVGCNNGRGSCRKTMSNEGGHSCLNNENKINMDV